MNRLIFSIQFCVLPLACKEAVLLCSSFCLRVSLFIFVLLKKVNLFIKREEHFVYFTCHLVVLINQYYANVGKM
jgi:hypothetical protein